MTIKATRRKELSRKIEDNKEFVVNEIYKFEFDGGVMEAINEVFDDGEYAADHGVYLDWRLEEIALIKVDNVLEEVEERIHEQEQDGETDSCFYNRLIIIRDYLKDWKGYTIWV